MSDVVSNSPEGLMAFWGRIAANGAGEGTGKAAMVKTAVDFAGMVHRGEMAPDDAPSVYAKHRNHAEMAAAADAKPLKAQNAESLASQVSKLRAVADLADSATKNPLAWSAIGWSKGVCEGKYTPFLSGIAAAKKTLAKKRDVDAVTLQNIVEAAATPKSKASATLTERIANIAKQLDAILDNDEGAFDTAIESLHTRFGGAPIETLRITARKVADMLAKLDAENTPDPEL